MRGWLVGLVIGLIVGAGAMYLGLRPPWGQHAAGPTDAGVVAVASDAKPAHNKRKKRRWRPRRGYHRRTSAGPEFADDGTDETEPAVPLIKLSAADRALEWRGQITTLPSRKIDMNAGPDARPLTQSEINAAVSRQNGPIRSCVVQGAAGTDLRTTITVKLIVGANGHVTKSQLRAPRYLFQKGLLACAQRALRGMTFPATGTPTLVTFPVQLT